MTDVGRGVHATAAAGFDRGAGAYARARPAYPADAVAYAVSDAATGLIVDVGAGTGKLTRQLVDRAPTSVVAVEPVGGMRAELARALPSVAVLEAEAAALPLRSASVDLVTAGQAIHWFATADAAREFARVLRPGGLFAVVQNVRDRGQALQRAVSELRESLAVGVPTFADGTWRSALEDAVDLVPAGTATFAHAFVLSHTEVLDHVRSLSPVAAAGDPDLDPVVRALRGEPDPVELRYTTEVHRWQRIP